MKKLSLFVDVNTEIADMAVPISIEHKLATVDALIYTSALVKNAILITMDNDFRGLKMTCVV